MQRIRSLIVRSTRFGGLMSASVYSQLVQFAFFLLAARVIAVAEFGLFSMVFAVAMGLTVLAEAGWREYIICNDDERLLARARGLAGLASIAIAIAGLIAAAIVWLVAQEMTAALTIAALALWVPLRSRCTLMWGQLTKENRVHHLSLSVFISESCGLIAGAAALFAGWGMLALGVSKLVLQVTALICLSSSRSRAGSTGSIWQRCPEDREMLSFSSQIMVGRISNFLRSNISVFVIGFGLSALAVGYYRAAARITGAALETLREPSRVILWSGVRDAGNGSDTPEAAQAAKAERLGPILLGFAALVLVLFALLAETLITVLLGVKWLPAAPVASILAIAYLVGFVTVLSEPLFSLTNQPKLARNLAITSSVISCVGIVIAAPFGLHAVAWSELGSSAATAVLTLYMLGRYTKFRPLRFLRSLIGPAFALLATFLVVEVLGASSLISQAPLILKLLTLAASGTLAFALVMGLHWMIAKRLRTGVGAMAGIVLCLGAAGLAWMGMPNSSGAAVTHFARTGFAPGATPHTPISGAPIPEPLIFAPMERDRAKLLNASIPFAGSVGAAARPFALAGDTVSRERAVDCLASAMWYEAGSDPRGQRAVGQVVLNRVRHAAFPSNVCGVVFQGAERKTGCQFTFTCDGALHRVPSDTAFAHARSEARAMLQGVVDTEVGLATHYHTDWVHPTWSAQLDKLARIDTHLFFRWRGKWGGTTAMAQRYNGIEPAIAALGGISPIHRGEAPQVLPGVLPALATAHAPVASPMGKPLDIAAIAAPSQPSNVFQLPVAPGGSAGAPALAALDLCDDRPFCKVIGTLPASADPAFLYIRDRRTGVEHTLWDCSAFPRKNTAQCLSDANRSWAGFEGNFQTGGA
jgi:O-antigen/teichoic acid export membrane protein